MNWKSYPDEMPKKEGKYIISVHRKLQSGTHVFNYTAHYNQEEDKWYKYDPFDDKYVPKVEITDKIAGWLDEVGAYFGKL